MLGCSAEVVSPQHPRWHGEAYARRGQLTSQNGPAELSVPLAAAAEWRCIQQPRLSAGANAV